MIISNSCCILIINIFFNLKIFNKHYKLSVTMRDSFYLQSFIRIIQCFQKVEYQTKRFLSCERCSNVVLTSFKSGHSLGRMWLWMSIFIIKYGNSSKKASDNQTKLFLRYGHCRQSTKQRRQRHMEFSGQRDRIKVMF